MYSFQHLEKNHEKCKIVRLRLRLIGKERQLLFKQYISPFELNPTYKPQRRTLLILNMPAWLAEEEMVKKAFKGVGKVHSVTFDERVQGFGFNKAYVVFSKEKYLDKALALSVLGPIDTPDEPILAGVRKWIKEYNDNLLIGEKIPEVFEEIRRKREFLEKILKAEEIETYDVEDQNGWTVVNTKSRHPGISRKESVGNRLQVKTEIKKKMLWNYYKHDIKESKQNEIVELRKKFKRDKLRAAEIKQIRNSRKFK